MGWCASCSEDQAGWVRSVGTSSHLYAQLVGFESQDLARCVECCETTDVFVSCHIILQCRRSWFWYHNVGEEVDRYAEVYPGKLMTDTIWSIRSLSRYSYIWAWMHRWRWAQSPSYHHISGWMSFKLQSIRQSVNSQQAMAHATYCAVSRLEGVNRLALGGDDPDACLFILLVRHTLMLYPDTHIHTRGRSDSRDNWSIWHAPASTTRLCYDRHHSQAA